MQTICIDEQCLKKSLWVVLNEKNMLKFNEDFIKNMMKTVIKDIFMK